MNTTEQNLVRLAALCRDDRKAFASVCALAKSIGAKSPTKAALNRKPTPAAEQRKAFFNQFSRPALMGAVAQHGGPLISNLMLTDYITQKAEQKFAQMRGAQ